MLLMEKLLGDMMNEDEIVKQYSYDKIKGIEIKITEYLTPETETNRYVAEFEFKKLHYYLSGTMNQR